MKSIVKFTWVLIIALGLTQVTNAVAQKSSAADKHHGPNIWRADYTDIHLSSHYGEKIDLCIDVRVKGQDVDHLIEPFRQQNETRLWQSEFWGKWILGAIDSYKYSKDPELFNKIKYGYEQLIETQLPNGYIGNYAEEAQLQHWDIWGRKYVLLGLISYYDLTGDKGALKASIRVADHLLSQVGPGKTNIVKTGNYRGMASSSVLEPIVQLYNRTGNKEYLTFAEWIVSQWETEEGPQLLSKSLKSVPVAERFPAPKEWWSWENGQKAYEMMSCYEGLLELYLVTGKDVYLNAAIGTVDEIIASEINVAGSGAAFECWYQGKQKQTEPAYHTMETCVTMTWMKLCKTLLQITGNPKYADQFEKTMYNSLLASMKFDGSEISKYSPLEGNRHAGENQCGMNINCCTANGPRGFALIPAVVYMQSKDEIIINLYNESETTMEIRPGNKVQLNQTTNYPENENVTIEIAPEKPSIFSVSLRIPLWSAITKVLVNGEEQKNIVPGSYFRIERKWNPGDKIEIEFDMRGRVNRRNGYWAVSRGPVLLARDSRFQDGFVDQAAVPIEKSGFIELIPVEEKPGNTWMAYSVPVIKGTDLEGEFRSPQLVMFSDFASAGNTWDLSTRYRVWIKETINVMQSDYDTY